MQKLFIVAALASAIAFVPSPSAQADRVIRGAVGEFIDTGGRVIDQNITQPARHGIEHAGRQLDKHVFQEIKENPEIVAAVLVASGVGWVACMDGCTLIVGGIISGSQAGSGAGFIGGAVGVINARNESTNSSESPSSHSSPTQSDASQPNDSKINEKTTEQKDLGGDATSEAPTFFSKTEFPKGPPREYLPFSTYDKSLKARATNTFAIPTFDNLLRVPSAKDIGGIYTSPRSDLGKSNEAVDAKEIFGSSARRMHMANDFLTRPGDLIVAPMSGKAAIQEWKKQDGTKFNVIVIKGENMTVARALYGVPAPTFNNPVPLRGYKEIDVRAGVTVIATSDNLSRSPNYEDTPNHVHVDVTVAGKRVDVYDLSPPRYGPWRIE